MYYYYNCIITVSSSQLKWQQKVNYLTKQSCLTSSKLNKRLRVRATKTAVPSKHQGCGSITWKGRTHFYTLTGLNSWELVPYSMPRACGNHINQCLHCEIKRPWHTAASPFNSCPDSTAQDLSSVTYPRHVCGLDLARFGDGLGVGVGGGM